MFEENNLGIDLSDAEIYFLAREMKLERLVGFSIDYDSMNKELKMEIKQEGYKLLESKNALQMDFSGNVVVDSRFADIIKHFENPQKVIVWQYYQKKDNQSQLRKAFISGDDIIALEYFLPAVSSVFRLNSTEDVNSFIKAGTAIENTSNNQSTNVLVKIEEIVDKCSEHLTLSTFTKEGDGYLYTESIYCKIDDIWFLIDQTENDSVEIKVVNESVEII